MNKVIKTFCLITSVILVFAFSGCAGKDDLDGTWTGKMLSDDSLDVTWEFDGEGGCKMEYSYWNGDGTYSISDDKVSVKMNGWDTQKTFLMKKSGSDLTLTDEVDNTSGYTLTKK